MRKSLAYGATCITCISWQDDGQQDVLSWIRETSHILAGTKKDISIRPYQNTIAIMTIAFCGDNARAFRDFMYKDATVWMERKREKADKW